MARHNLFYYPYASISQEQLPLLKVAALWFDKLFVLDPVGASWETIGADHLVRDAVQLLAGAKILETVSPVDVLAKYATPLADAIRRDLSDDEFLNLCRAHAAETGKAHWTLALAKVPANPAMDDLMRRLLGDLPRELASRARRSTAKAPGNVHHDDTEVAAHNERNTAPELPVYDEYREGYDGDVEYRYTELPLAIGEAIMTNHALFAGLMHASATPVTDDAFHSRALSVKLGRAAREPALRELRESLGRDVKAHELAVKAFTDAQLDLPVLRPEVPLEEILEYRLSNDTALREARETLGWMARRIESAPWSDEFAKEIEHKTIPEVAAKLAEAGRARDSWLKSQRGRLALKVTGVSVGVATAVLTVVAAPAVPIALALAGLGLVSGSAIPGAEWLLDRRDGRDKVKSNGLHYLLRP